MKWGDNPNISRLVSAIAQNSLQVVRNNDWSKERIAALDRARKALIDNGEILQAQNIARILLPRCELSPTLKQELETFLANPQPAWRQRIDEYLTHQQPFRLIYQDAQDHQWTYTILGAKILPIERRQYLACRCVETEGNQDIPELCHNWTLRLDRILEAAVTPIEQPWIDLQEVRVTLHLYQGLAFGYRNYKPDDIHVGEVEGDPPCRRVVRKVYSTFWLLRDILKYGDECEIIAPGNVRDRAISTLRAMNRRYGID